jgi:[glutamine synthetase] adenylyltransferase / [glutamine synthetase]-adenylyl-L-tyrosine phosphorylase
MTDSLFPNELLPAIDDTWQALLVQAGAETQATLKTLKDDFYDVCAVSDYARTLCQRYPDIVIDLFTQGDLSRSYPPNTYRQLLAAQLENIEDQDMVALMRALRLFRGREMLRILWRDLLGLADLNETVTDLSRFANDSIDTTLEMLFRWLADDQATPYDKTDQPARMLVIAMGKLGGQELNFSSDVDLIFVYPDDAHFGDETISAEAFYTKLAQNLIYVLQSVTEDGFVFRVDMRLRPQGTSGPLVMSIKAFQNYYQEQGRDWERYALIRARIICGNKSTRRVLQNIIKQFVYRRYVDYGAIESLRHTKQLIAREVETQGLQNDIKRGPGGIRQVEFIVQSFQLIRGGQDKNLQQRKILPILKYLAESETLNQQVVDELSVAYAFLRNVEHRLQMQADRQTHALPMDELNQWRLAYALGKTDWPALLNKLDGIRHQVSFHFQAMLSHAEAEQSDICMVENFDELKPLWLGQLEQDAMHQILTKFKFSDPDKVMLLLEEFRNNYRCRSLTLVARKRLDALMPQVLHVCSHADFPETSLIRMLQILDATIKRSAYIVLLLENPKALKTLINLLDKSAWVSELIRDHPVLLDEFVRPQTRYQQLTRKQLADNLRQVLLAIPEQELDQQMDVLRRFKHRHTLRMAIAELTESYPLVNISRGLTSVATVLIRQVLSLAWQDIQARYGHDDPPLAEFTNPNFAIIAYGKLGANELNYASDLDLVFLHDNPGYADKYTIRLAQRIIHMLSTRTGSGFMYQVDTRLRPSGEAGLLVSPFSAFSDYQKSSAWTWEHQALVRARVISGSDELRAQFTALRQEVLAVKRDIPELQEQVLSMRSRMLESHQVDPQFFDIKRDHDGLADIDFIVQYSVLAWAWKYPSLLEHTDSLKILTELAAVGVMSDDDAHCLSEAYVAYRRQIHYCILRGQLQRATQGELQSERAGVNALWQRIFGHKD